MLAYAPLFPHPKEEKWNFIVADTANNTVYNRQEVSLIEAEAVGISHPVSYPTTQMGGIVFCNDVLQACAKHRMRSTHGLQDPLLVGAASAFCKASHLLLPLFLRTCTACALLSSFMA